MTTKNILFTRFNTSFDPNEPRFQQCVSNEDWWETRLKILTDYFIKSLNNQSHFLYEGVASFADQIDDLQYKVECEMMLDIWNMDINYESSIMKTQKLV